MTHILLLTFCFIIPCPFTLCFVALYFVNLLPYPLLSHLRSRSSLWFVTIFVAIIDQLWSTHVGVELIVASKRAPELERLARNNPNIRIRHIRKRVDIIRAARV